MLFGDSASGGAGAAFGRGAFLDSPRPVPDELVANVSVCGATMSPLQMLSDSEVIPVCGCGHGHDISMRTQV